MKKILLLLLALTSLLASCMVTPLKPGMSEIVATNFTSRMKQSENPATSSAQKFDETTESVSLYPNAPDDRPYVVRSKTVRHADTTVGAAQKDMARELGAKLKSLSFLVYLGVILFLFGLATLVYPPLRLIVGSMTTSVMIVAAGLALIFLPVLVVGHELLILGVAGGAVLVWFLAHRHGLKSSAADVYQSILKQVLPTLPPSAPK